MSTSYVLIVFALVIVSMIVLISKCNVNASFGILIAAIILAIALGTPWEEIEPTINSGFAGTIEDVAIVIFLGCTMGTVLEKTGAAVRITKWAIGLVGEKAYYLGDCIELWYSGNTDLGGHSCNFVNSDCITPCCTDQKIYDELWDSALSWSAGNRVSCSPHAGSGVCGCSFKCAVRTGDCMGNYRIRSKYHSSNIILYDAENTRVTKRGVFKFCSRA